MRFALVALSIVAGAGTASADSVRAVVNLNVDTGGGQKVPLSVEKEVGFGPGGDTITVDVSGYRCTMGSSTQGSVPAGCNYSVDVTGAEPKITPREADGTCMKVQPQCVKQ
ncbi:hypothetical protein SMD10_09155 [Consotaella sp. CSK11QG-6]